MRTVNVYLTKEILLELASGRNQAAGTQEEVEDIVITQVDECGGILVHQASSVGEEGSGVWMDASGCEHFSGGGDFHTSDEATDYHRAALMPVEDVVEDWETVDD